MGSSPIRRIESRNVATCDSVAAGEQLHAGCCEFGAVGTPARERVDGQQVLEMWIMDAYYREVKEREEKREQYVHKKSRQRKAV